ncbi:MAG: SUMF1/EgtB/PvdO family nonheme iron enzyme [Anaerolineae bacterium]|nr:SUMF1/EgtB/PvdO family nonheme iron enzyme [Anaerolineae bacterium]
MNPLFGKKSNSSISFGERNIFSGSIRDVAGRDINKYYNNFYYIEGRVPIRELEISYLTHLISEFSELDSLFVPLSLSIDTHQSVSDPASSAIPPEFRFLKSSPKASSSPPSILESVEQLFLIGSQWLLTGETGSGKSTLLSKLALDVARSTLSSLHGTAPTYTGLGHNSPRLPIFIDASDFEKNSDISSFINARWIGSSVGLDFEVYLKRKQAVLLVDNLDRVPAKDRSHLVTELYNLAASNSGNKFLFATQLHSLQSNMGIFNAVVQPLNPERALELMRRYCRTWHYTEARATELHQLLFEGEKPNELLWAAKIPYTLLMLLYSYSDSPIALDNLAELSAKFTRTMLEREILSSHEFNNGIDQIIRDLSTLAFNSTWGSKDKLFPTTEAESKSLEIAWRAGILNKSIEGSKTKYSFSHNMLQSYLSALQINEFDKPTYSSWISTMKINSAQVRESSFLRSPIFTDPQTEEIPWDAPLPILPRVEHFNSLRMLIGIARAPAELFNELLNINTFLVADLLTLLEKPVDVGILPQTKERLQTLLIDPERSVRIRFTAGYWLGILGDVRLDNDSKIYVTGLDQFYLGDEYISCLVSINDFYVDKYLVTNYDFNKFINDNGYKQRELWTPEGWEWVYLTGRSQPAFWHNPRFDSPNCPVIGVSWYEANAYARWKRGRLLNEAEWEYLATYSKIKHRKQIYPWGDDFREDAANLFHGEYLFRTSPVGMYPKGINDWQIADLAGNTWEWLSSLYLPYPFDLNKTEHSNINGSRCLRGGSWAFDNLPGAKGATRYYGNPAESQFNIGFRCAYDT